ncbi:MAG TPA: ABC transporter ATP-binding protein [Candidatus Pelagibacter sp.]|jgi:subfamily B ATP-binding cassette protein MsbA|nr:ABC transporter ATP-binding protein [Candidatus Pelagibacter sp.]
MNLDDVKKNLSRLFHFYVKKHIFKLILALILSFGVAGGTAAIAWLLDPAVKKIFVEQDKSMMTIIPIAIILAFSLKGLSLYFARVITIQVGQRIVRELQVEMTSVILKSDTTTIDSKHSGKYLSHFLYDVGLVNNLVSGGVLNLMKDSLTLIVLVSLMFYQNWKLACFALLMMPLAVIASKTLGKRIGKATTLSAEISGNVTTFLSEMIKGSRMIKIYQKENYEFDKSNKLFTELMETQIKIGFIMVRVQPIMEILTGGMIAGFIYFTGIMVASGEIEINNFFSFLTAMMLAYQPIRSLATIHMMFYQGAAASERVFGIIDTKINIKEDKNLPSLKINKANIEFKDVNFSYPTSDAAAIENINISIDGGSTAALVGHSGAGKSTIINLLPRFYDPNKGQIHIDKQNIHNVTLSSLRNNISLVSQDIVLFDDTVRANIAYANLNASEEQIISACNFAAATDFIKNLPKSFDTIIGENGVRLSGGQKQRISIARAILKNSPIILLDEATSSLDADSEEKVQNAILNLTKNKTTLVIAHRLSTIMRANKIIVLNQGKIADTGTHKELIKNSSIYKNLYSKQVSTN